MVEQYSIQYATGDQWRNNSRNNEEMEPKQKHHPVVDVAGDRSKVRCCKEQYYIGTWNVRSMNLKARIMKWFAIPFSGEARFVIALHHDPSIYMAWLIVSLS